MDFTRIIKNVLPAVVVLVAGLFGINFVYNTYMKDGASTVITLEPAAGEDAAVTEEGAAAVEGQGAVVDGVVEEAAVPAEETPAPAVDCTAVKAAAEAAVGTPGEEAAKKGVVDCEAAAAAAAATAPAATEAAVPAEAAVEGAAKEAVTEGEKAVEGAAH